MSYKTIYAHKKLALISDEVDIQCPNYTLNGSTLDSSETISTTIGGAFVDADVTLQAHISGPMVTLGFQGQSVATTGALTALFPVGTLPVAYRPATSCTFPLQAGIHNGVAIALQGYASTDGSIELGLQNSSVTGVPLPFTVNALANGWPRFSATFMNNIPV